MIRRRPTATVHSRLEQDFTRSPPNAPPASAKSPSLRRRGWGGLPLHPQNKNPDSFRVPFRFSPPATSGYQTINLRSNTAARKTAANDQCSLGRCPGRRFGANLAKDKAHTAETNRVMDDRRTRAPSTWITGRTNGTFTKVNTETRTRRTTSAVPQHSRPNSALRQSVQQLPIEWTVVSHARGRRVIHPVRIEPSR